MPSGDGQRVTGVWSADMSRQGHQSLTLLLIVGFALLMPWPAGLLGGSKFTGMFCIVPE